MPRRGAGDERDLAGQRLVESATGAASVVPVAPSRTTWPET
jgi:hypothetical protein